MPLPSGVQLIVCGTRPPTRSPRGSARLIMSDVLKEPGVPQYLGVLYICAPVFPQPPRSRFIRALTLSGEKS